jgi:monoamine oxidase
MQQDKFTVLREERGNLNFGIQLDGSQNFYNKLFMKKPVIVIGAGAAGLMAAYDLSRKGYKVIIVEASEHIGGRIHTYYPEQLVQPLELGAEFVHGALPVTLELLNEADIPYRKVKGKMYRVHQGQWEKDKEQIEGWKELAEKMKQMENEEDSTLEHFLSLYFRDGTYKDLRQSVRSFAEGFDLADPQKASIKALWEEWSHEEEKQYRIPGGYCQLIEYLANACQHYGVEVLKNCTVQEISWKENAVTVTAVDGLVLLGEKIILAVPLSVLQKGAAQGGILFSPALAHVHEAANKIGWGNVIKFVLKFNGDIGDKKDLGFILSDEEVPTWWTQSPGDTSLLTGWLGGPKAEKMEKLAEEVLRVKALQSLSSIFGLSLESLETRLEICKIIKWGTIPFIEGGYSYDTPESTVAKNILKTSIAETIYIAGEAFYSGSSSGTVEAALVSGREAAERLAGGGQN